MSYIRKKIIKGREYWYEQESKRVGDKVTTKHVRYIGSLPFGATTSGMTRDELRFMRGNPKYLGSGGRHEDRFSFERFDLSKAKKVGSGRDRVVYQLPDGKILKIAKNPHGLMQNESEGDYGCSLRPDVYEVGVDYVVVERIDIDKKRSNTLVKELAVMSDRALDKAPPNMTTSQRIEFGSKKAMEKMDEKYEGFMNFMNYNIAIGDFMRATSWGWKKDTPILIDAGCLDRESLNEPPDKFTKEDWRKVIDRRRVSRKKGHKIATR